jgi:hypothetical protein
MKLTKSQLKQIIKEELSKVLKEAVPRLNIEYVGWDNEYDQTSWQFKVNGEEYDILWAGASADADDLADALADRLGPPYEENPEAIEAIKEFIINSRQPAHVQDAAAAMQGYADDQYSHEQ